MPSNTPPDILPLVDDPAKKQWEKLPKLAFVCAPHVLLIVAVLLAYANVYHNGFVLDDTEAIVHNRFLRHWSDLPNLLTGLSLSGDNWTLSNQPLGFHRPLFMLVIFFIYQVFGPSLPAFHFLNVFLHVGNACLVYGVGCRLGFRQGASFLAALLWAVHPIHTEAIDWVSSAADPLCTAFLLSGLLVLLPDFAPRKFWLATLLFVLALASKESAIVFPALVTITLCLVNKTAGIFATYFRTWPLWLFGTLYVAGLLTYIHGNDFRLYSQNDTGYSQLYVHNLYNRILTCLATLPVYLRLLIWPAGLHIERGFSIFNSFWNSQVMAGAAMIALMFLQVIWGQARRGLAMSWGFLWFAAAYSPDSSIVLPVNAMLTERWMYLPTIGIALGMAQTIAAWIDLKSGKARIIFSTLVILAALALGIKTYLQNEVWRDSGTLYGNLFRCGESSGRAHDNLGIYYAEHGEFEKAIEQFQLAINHPDSEAQSMMPSLHTNLALVYLRVRVDETDPITILELRQVLPLCSQIPEAIEELNRALALDPDSYTANEILAVIYAYQGDSEKVSFYNTRAELSRQKK